MPRICEGVDTSQVITDPGIRSINIFIQRFHNANICKLETFWKHLAIIY